MELGVMQKRARCGINRHINALNNPGLGEVPAVQEAVPSQEGSRSRARGRQLRGGYMPARGQFVPLLRGLLSPIPLALVPAIQVAANPPNVDERRVRHALRQ